MASTTPDNIWIPDSDTPMVLDTMFANLASSLQNGIGARVKKLESFVGGFLRNNTEFELSALGTIYPITTVSTDGTGGFASGMTVNNGAITVQTAGIYTITASVSALRVASGTTVGLLTGFIQVGGTVRSSGYAHVNQANSFEASVSMGLVANLSVGDTITLAARATGYAQTLRVGTTTNVSIALTARA